MEAEAQEIYAKAREAAHQCDSEIALVGILPTLTKKNLGLDSMVPLPRYHALNDAIMALRGQNLQFAINGIDQLTVNHDNLMLEACNTSFQVHFQVSPADFARLYNIAQVVLPASSIRLYIIRPLIDKCVHRELQVLAAQGHDGVIERMVTGVRALEWKFPRFFFGQGRQNPHQCNLAVRLVRRFTGHGINFLRLGRHAAQTIRLEFLHGKVGFDVEQTEFIGETLVIQLVQHLERCQGGW